MLFVALSTKMRPRQYKILLPEPVLNDLKVLITDYYRQFGDSKRSRTFVDSAAFFLSILTNSLVSDHRKNEVTSLDHRVPKEHWCTHLYSPILRDIFGNDYLLVVGYLAEKGFVGRSNHYEIGNGNCRGRSKAYWFTAKYGTYLAKYLNSRSARRFSNESVKVFGKFRSYTIKSKTVLDRWFAVLEKRKEDSFLDPIVDTCYKNLEHFSIDTKAADATFEKLRAEGKMTNYKEKLERAKIQRFNDVGTEPYAMYVKHDRYGRIHTNVTCMKKELRASALRCDGKEVGEVDIKSSQIAFIVPVFKRYLEVFAEEDCEPSGDTFIQFRPFWREGQREYTMEKMSGELNVFSGLVNSHQIYEYFAKELSEDFDLDKTVTRDEAKSGLVSFLFSPRYFDEEREPVRAAVKRVWEDKFPTLLRCLYSMKQNCHAALAYELQKVESNFIFNRVCPRITNELGCPFCTVHDSVIVPKEFCGRLKKIMDAELAKLGIPTITEVEYYDMVEASMPCLIDEGFFAEMTRRGIKTVDTADLIEENVAIDE